MSTTDSMDAFEAWAKENAVDIYDEVPRDAWKSALDWQAATEAAKATGTAGELMPLDEVAQKMFDDIFGICGPYYHEEWLKTSVKALLKTYGKACAEAARQPAPVLSDKQIIEACREIHISDFEDDISGYDKAIARAILAAANGEQQ